MKKSITLFVLGGAALICLPATGAQAATFRVKSQTMARFYERDSANKKDLLALPLYEYLDLAWDDPEESGISLNFGGWGRKNLGDDGVFTDNETGEMNYGYLDWRSHGIKTRLGRQAIFSGPASEVIDGASAAYSIKGYRITAFAGLPVSLEGENGSSGDFAYGGRVAFSPKKNLDLAFSYKEITSNSHRDSEETSGDIVWGLPKGMLFSGRSTWSIKTSDFSEHDLALTIPQGADRFELGFQRISYADFFAADDKTAGPFLYLKDSPDSLNQYRATWTRTGERLELGGKIKYYDNSNAARDAWYGGVTASLHGEELSQTGVEAGRMESDDARSRFTLLRVFTFIDRLPLDILPVFASADLVYARYDEKINNEDYSLFASAGCGTRFLDDTLEIKISGDYSVDPYYSSDMKTTLYAVYRWQKGGDE